MLLSLSTRINRVLILGLIAISATLTSHTVAQAQSGNTRDRNQTGSGFGTEGFYYIDDVGLQLSIGAMAQEGYVDPATYRLGRMDVLSIEIQGVAPILFRGLIVNADGALVIPTVGIVSVRDITLNEAIVRVRQAMSQKYRSDQISVTLERLKPVLVHITGDVDTTRSLVIPANTRLSNVITPIIQNMSGQQVLTRFIEIKNRTGETRIADLEAFQLGGFLEDNPFLQDGDVILLTNRTWSEPRISITGGVPRQILFDYRDDDNLTKLFRIASGYRFDADTSHFLINRIEGNRVTQIRVEGSITQNSDYPLLANDRIVIPVLPDSYVMHAATIRGEVSVPGTYPIIRNRSTLEQLIAMSGGLKSTALTQGIIVERRAPRILPNQGNLFARTSDQYTEGFEYLQTERELSSFIFLDVRNPESYDFVIMDQDVITIPKDETTVYVFGQVNRTGYYVHKPGQTVKQYLELAGGFGLAAEASRIFVIKSGSYIWLTPEQTTVESGDMIFVDRKPYEDIQTARQYDLQIRSQRNSTIGLVMTTITTLATLVSTIYIVTR